ncbi:MAG: hypothetical protein E7289_05030 [Lachnospiraceae bacterium]|nr:hypothetical protein [Lachnospiraceae bacterium]
MDINKLKVCIRIMIYSIVISAVFLYATCFFNECSLLQAWDHMEVRPWVIFSCILNGYVLLVCLLVVGLGFTPLPEIPGQWEKEQLIVCRYADFTYSALAVLCIGMATFMLYGAYVNVTNPGGWNPWEAAIVLGGASVMFYALGGVFLMFMVNYVLVLYPGGFVFRNLLRKKYCIEDVQVEYVSVIYSYKHRSFRLKTPDRNFWINRYCSHYYEAEKYVCAKYPDMETYRNMKQEVSSR